MRSLLKKIGPLKALVTWLRSNSRFNYSRVIKSYGELVKIPVRGGFYVSVSEVWMYTLLEELLSIKQGVFIDVGVNLGQTLIKVKCINPQIEYLGFEPNPICVWYSKELIKVNMFTNTVIIPVGLFNKSDVLSLTFWSSNEVDSSASVIEGFRKASIKHKEYVAVLRFDDYMSKFEFKDISVIKIDVEGAELEVIDGLRHTIASFRPILLLEVLPVYSSQDSIRKTRQEELEHILSELNYSTHRVRKSENEAYLGLQKLVSIGIHSDLSQCDYVIIPNELLNFFNET